jgi:hypothetical protein
MGDRATCTGSALVRLFPSGKEPALPPRRSATAVVISLALVIALWIAWAGLLAPQAEAKEGAQSLAGCQPGWHAARYEEIGIWSGFADVAALSPDDVWAVGSYRSDPAQWDFKALLEHWNGEAWSLVAAPPLPNPHILQAVEPISPDDVWAGGATLRPDAEPFQTLIEHWDGEAWRVVPSPNPGGAGGGTEHVIAGVSAASSSDVWAVGLYRQGYGTYKTLTVHWDGDAWSVVPSPSPGFQNSLSDVVALSSDDVWAVGHFNNQSLIEHWDGMTWEVVPTPESEGSGDAHLHGLSAVSPSEVWAVGYSTYYSEEHGAGGWKPLVLRWNGTAWKRIPVPRFAGQYSWFNDIQVLSQSRAFAVGGMINRFDRHNPGLIERWDGENWKQVGILEPPGEAGDAQFSGIDVLETGDAWAVGSRGWIPGSGPAALIVRYCASAW